MTLKLLRIILLLTCKGDFSQLIVGISMRDKKQIDYCIYLHIIIYTGLT
jgi:hypothetical protein